MRSIALAAALLSTALAPSCVIAIGNEGNLDDEGRRHTRTSYASSHSPSFASARIEGRSGVELDGKVTFRESRGGVEIELSLEDAPPGWHAVHVHEFGDCSASDGATAGGHFNPDGHIHGAPSSPEAHAGDLGNVWVDEHGDGHLLLFSPVLSVAPGPHSVLGRSIIVHASHDDMISQPSGAAGARIGCGVIQ